MSWSHVRAQWKLARRQARLRWDRLTDEDLARVKGHRETLVACLQERYGYPHDRAQQEVRDWEHRF